MMFLLSLEIEYLLLFIFSLAKLFFGFLFHYSPLNYYILPHSWNNSTRPNILLNQNPMCYCMQLLSMRSSSSMSNFIIFTGSTRSFVLKMIFFVEGIKNGCSTANWKNCCSVCICGTFNFFSLLNII